MSLNSPPAYQLCSTTEISKSNSQTCYISLCITGIRRSHGISRFLLPSCWFPSLQCSLRSEGHQLRVKAKCFYRLGFQGNSKSFARQCKPDKIAQMNRTMTSLSCSPQNCFTLQSTITFCDCSCLSWIQSSMTPTAPSIRSRERPYRGHGNIFQLSKQNEDKTKDLQHSQSC